MFGLFKLVWGFRLRVYFYDIEVDVFVEGVENKFI